MNHKIDSKKVISIMTEVGVFLGLYMIMDYTAHFAVGWIFPEGLSISVSYILIIIIGIRHGAIVAATMKFVATWLLAVIGGVGTMFPPTNQSVFLPIFITILFDFTISTFFATYIGVISVKKINNIKLKIIIAALVSGIISFFSGFTSGVLVWGIYAWSGWGVYLYSFIQNISNYGSTIVIAITIGLPIAISVPDKIKWTHEPTHECFFI